MKSKKFSVMLGIVFCALVAQAQDTSLDSELGSDPLDVTEPQQQKEESTSVEPPDYSKESRFHRIYKDFNEQPTSVESWEKAIGARRSEIYKVQKGDTLSGISTTLFGDQFFWPKVWSLNHNQILNPHEIAPGMSVQFFPGSAEDAPTLQLGSEAPEGAAVDVAATEVPPVTESAAPSGGVVKLPPPKKRTPLLKVLPGSLPVVENQILKAPALDMQIAMPQSNFPEPLEYLEHYIVEAPLQGAGVITGIEMGLKSAGEHQFVFVRLDGDSGKNYVAQQNMTALVDPADKKRQGHMVEVQGELEILEKVNSEKNIYRAIVKKAIEPVEVGAVLTPGNMPMISAATGTVVSGVGAKIMGGQYEAKRKLFGSRSLVFLDSGSSQGLQEGQTLSIYADERVRDKKTEALENDRVIGLLKVVRVTPSFATAYVIKAMADIQVGDYVGKVTAQVSAPIEPSDPGEPVEPSTPEEESPPESGSEELDLEL